MKRSEIEALVEMPPQRRAMRLLEIGKELKSRAKSKRLAMPKSLKAASVTDEAPGRVIKWLHGDDSEEVRQTRGLTRTGRILKTAAGAAPDLVLTARARKKVARAAMSKKVPVKELAVRQLGLGMLESHPHARVCAAYAYWQATGLTEAVVPILTNAANSPDADERLLGTISLAKVQPELVEPLQGKVSADKAMATRSAATSSKSMTVIVHGTFARKEPWYQPGGDFHTYIARQVYADVYSKSDFFFWSGSYALTDAELKKIWTAAANKLVSWCRNHPTKKLRLICHSHGCNVVNIATQKGLQACSLIQLSPPVRKWNLPDMLNVSGDRIFNMHSTHDPVVAVDGGAQNYDGTLVDAFERERIVSFFSHSDSHDKGLWKKKKVPKLVKTVCQ